MPTIQNTYWIPADGIAREVIQADICRYLGNDALVKPSVRQDRHGYSITAYRNLTSEMIADLKADSQRWQSEKASKSSASYGVPYPKSETHQSRQYHGPTSSSSLPPTSVAYGAASIPSPIGYEHSSYTYDRPPQGYAPSGDSYATPSSAYGSQTSSYAYTPGSEYATQVQPRSAQYQYGQSPPVVSERSAPPESARYYQSSQTPPVQSRSQPYPQYSYQQPHSREPHGRGGYQ